MVNPFSRSAMFGAPNWMHGVVVIVHVTSPTSRLSSTTIFVTLMTPLMSSAAAGSTHAARNSDTKANRAKGTDLMTSSLYERWDRRTIGIQVAEGDVYLQTVALVNG
jgi:hypothetical protein